MAAALKFVSRHNSVLTIDIEDQENAYYHQILNFLLRSRIHHLITHNPPVVARYIRDFWSTAQYDEAVQPPVIRAVVDGHNLHFSLADVRRILQLGNDVAQDNERIEFPPALRAGAFTRMGYQGDARRMVVKNGLYGQWRFLAHVIIQCLSAKKGGFDALNAREQSMMVALVFNKPFSFSKYFFEAFKELIQGTNKFLLFPRFIMMIIMDRLPELQLVGATLNVSPIGARVFADCRTSKIDRPITDLETALFGHLINEHYVAPPNDGWVDIPVNQPEDDVPVIGVVAPEASAGEQQAQQQQEQQQQ